VDIHPFITKPIEVQGPWGGGGGGSFCDGLATGIKGLTIISAPEVVWSLCVEYDICGQSFQSSPHGDSSIPGKKDEVRFNYPDEYLQQIEGFFGIIPGVVVGNNPVTGITSLTFKSNIQSYGPYGTGGEIYFKSGIGKIVGFWGRSGMVLDQIGVFIANPT
jgi:hypothetical protein